MVRPPMDNCWPHTHKLMEPALIHMLASVDGRAGRTQVLLVREGLVGSAAADLHRRRSVF
jgi:hypothetical protein